MADLLLHIARFLAPELRGTLVLRQLRAKEVAAEVAFAHHTPLRQPCKERQASNNAEEETVVSGHGACLQRVAGLACPFALVDMPRGMPL